MFGKRFLVILSLSRGFGRLKMSLFLMMLFGVPMMSLIEPSLLAWKLIKPWKSLCMGNLVLRIGFLFGCLSGLF